MITPIGYVVYNEIPHWSENTLLRHFNTDWSYTCESAYDSVVVMVILGKDAGGGCLCECVDTHMCDALLLRNCSTIVSVITFPIVNYSFQCVSNISEKNVIKYNMGQVSETLIKSIFLRTTRT